jgi:hypothetical protein
LAAQTVVVPEACSATKYGVVDSAVRNRAASGCGRIARTSAALGLGFGDPSLKALSKNAGGLGTTLFASDTGG